MHVCDMYKKGDKYIPMEDMSNNAEDKVTEISEGINGTKKTWTTDMIRGPDGHEVQWKKIMERADNTYQ